MFHVDLHAIVVVLLQYYEATTTKSDSTYMLQTRQHNFPILPHSNCSTLQMQARQIFPNEVVIPFAYYAAATISEYIQQIGDMC